MSRPIADYALLSDCHRAALVSRGGSVDWLCVPRFDSPSLFGRLLDEDAGHWSIGPVEDCEVRREYADGSLVLRTVFRTGQGEAVLTDGLATGPNERGHELGAGAPGALLRRVECTEGRVRLDIGFAPRPEYGLVHPVLESCKGGIRSRGGPVAMVLSSPVELEVDGSHARGAVDLEEGNALHFALHFRPTWWSAPEVWQPREIEARIGETLAAWRSWSDIHQGYQGPWAELVHHSGRVLQGLTYRPTGAIIAAPTTSLPEAVGGERNWDYRYAWVRDASLTLEALWIAACPDEAQSFFDFLAGASLGRVRRGDAPQIVFGIGGEHELVERELPRLSGWRGSRPVRVGNAAFEQKQLDVYGEIFAAVVRLEEQVEPDPTIRELLRSLADQAAQRWHEDDHGLWEIRSRPRPYLHSRLMCWVAVDRAIKMADVLEPRAATLESWKKARREIREAIEGPGWSEDLKSFRQALDGDELDAATLMIPIVGFLPADDERVRSTIRAVQEHLTDDAGLVFRYRSDDGIQSGEGTFLLCTFWLAHALALAGDPEEARRVFERACAFVNDVGLLSEEVDAGTGELLGNFPQAFSHVGLVTAAWAIHQAEQERTAVVGAEPAEAEGP
ncbi:MAG TPA: glycoside hydrolase family 15 protein [Longimicrobiales bacterium]|nr:glycoside hydrolase family 15 protein [Longimicrobiales bacterium]